MCIGLLVVLIATKVLLNGTPQGAFVSEPAKGSVSIALLNSNTGGGGAHVLLSNNPVLGEGSSYCLSSPSDLAICLEFLANGTLLIEHALGLGHLLSLTTNGTVSCKALPNLAICRERASDLLCSASYLAIFLKLASDASRLRCVEARLVSCGLVGHFWLTLAR